MNDTRLKGLNKKMSTQRFPKPLAEAPNDVFSKIQAVFFDIDDTFSSECEQGNKILPEAFQALWKLHQAGFFVVPVTGRPAGWCDHIARMWPVSAIVGENGAFYCYMSEDRPRRLIKKYLEASATRKKNAERLKRLHRSILRAFPRAKVPSDQLFREFDLAIDYCEDVPRWKDAEVQRLLEFCRNHGAMAKLSSIHVNIWFGKYDKWSCVRRVLSQLFSINSDEEKQKVLYIGDSPNDEPFFERLPITVGVANIVQFLEPSRRMKHAPAYVTQGLGGAGFAELAGRLLETKERCRENG